MRIMPPESLAGSGLYRCVAFDIAFFNKQVRAIVVTKEAATEAKAEQVIKRSNIPRRASSYAVPPTDAEGKCCRKTESYYARVSKSLSRVPVLF